jgi:hypothetical protein
MLDAKTNPPVTTMQSEQLKKELKEVAEILNLFKSEAVQLKVLDMLTGQLSPPEAPTEARRGARRRQKQAANEDPKLKAKTAEPSDGKPAGRTSGKGAHSIIMRLLEGGFFDKAQTISGIAKHASERLGHHLKANECSPTLLRLLRSGRLTRSKNRDGQYEYIKA